MRCTFSIALLIATFSCPIVSRADCTDDAANAYGVNSWILRAIAMQESGGNANTIHKNKNGTVDVGISGINEVHFAHLKAVGILPHDLLDPCVSMGVEARLLSGKMDRYGNSWKAVGAYHSETPAERDKYAAQIRKIIEKWKVMGYIHE